MDVTSIVTLLVYVGLIIFLFVFSCIIYCFQSQTKVFPLGHFNLQQQCQTDIQESGNMKNLQKMKTLRSDRKSFLKLSNSPRPKPSPKNSISDDSVENISKEMGELNVKVTNDPREQGTQISMYFQNEVDGGIKEIMTSIQNDLELKGLYLNGPEAQKNLKTTAIDEWNDSFKEGNAK